MAFDHRKYQAFKPVRKTDRRWPDKVIEQAPLWCSVDLRDGNQALVNPMNVEQKTRLFELLVKVGFKEIEIGFPAASQPDFDFCRKLIDEDRIPDDVTVQALTQARPELIARTYEALAGAKRAVVHLYNSTSTVQREQVFQLDKAGIKAIAVRGAEWVLEHAQQHPHTDWTFQYSPESFTGTELDYAVEVIDAVSAVWQPQNGQRMIINLPATVEMATPNVFADQVEWVCENMQHRSHIEISLHTHNDRGCGVAAAELGVMAGADRIEGTLLGNGERTGNMDVVTMAMNLYSQGIDPKLDFSDMAEVIRTVEACTEISTHPRHPYAGELVFTAFSGSHQDAIRKCLSRYREGDIWQVAYLPIDPRDLNRRYEEVVRINSQSGKGGVAYVIEQSMGITLPRWAQIEMSRLVQLETERSGKEISVAAIKAVFEDNFMAVNDDWILHGYDIHRTDEGVLAELEIGSGQKLQGKGHGVIEAVVAAIQSRYELAISIENYDEFAIGLGTTAQAICCLRLRSASAHGVGHLCSAAAIAEDTTSTAIQALLTGASRLQRQIAAASSTQTPAVALSV